MCLVVVCVHILHVCAAVMYFGGGHMRRIRFYTNALYRMKSNQIYLSAYDFHSSAPSGSHSAHFDFMNELYASERCSMRVCVHALEIM